MAVEPIGVRNGRVLGVGIGAVVILVVTRMCLTTYFTMMTDREFATKRVAGGVERIHAFRAEEGKALDKGQVPLDRAMASAANRQRAVDPKPSTDNAAIDGWKELPKEPPPGWPLPPPLPVLEGADAGLDAALDASLSDAGAKTDASAPTAVEAGATHAPDHH